MYSKVNRESKCEVMMRLPLLLGEHGQLSSGIKFNILYFNVAKEAPRANLMALNWESPPVGIVPVVYAAFVLILCAK